MKMKRCIRNYGGKQSFVFLTLVLLGIVLTVSPIPAETVPHEVENIEGEELYGFSSQELGATAQGFVGDVDVEFLVDSELQIVEIEVVAPHESPQYLERVEEWARKLEGEELEDFLEPEEIDTVSGATITANAVLRALESSARVIQEKDVELAPGEEPEVFSGIRAGLVLLVFTAAAIFLFHRRVSPTIRKIYLLLLLLVPGFYFNLQYSYSQFWALLNLQIPPVFHLDRLVLFILPFAIGLFYGRFYCGWLCPFGALQELVSIEKLKYKPPRIVNDYLHWFRFLLVLLLVGSSFYFSTNIFAVEPLEEIFIFWTTPWWNSLLLLAAVAGSLFIFRFWCRFFCPVGAVFSLLNKIALFDWVFKKKFGFCDQDQRSLRGLRCFHCERCFGEFKREVVDSKNINSA